MSRTVEFADSVVYDAYEQKEHRRYDPVGDHLEVAASAELTVTIGIQFRGTADSFLAKPLNLRLQTL